jgi:hypothetical protein
LEVIGQQTVSLRTGESEFRHTFLICTLPTRAAGLLGIDFLKRTQARIDLGKAVMSWNPCERDEIRDKADCRQRTAFTIFSAVKDGHNTLPLRTRKT